MKSLFEILAYTWLVFSLALIPILMMTHEAQGDVGEHYFRISDKLYYVGFLGDVNE